MLRVDASPWRWVDGNRNPIIVQGLSPGRHRIPAELADANHHVIDQQAVDVTLPDSTSKPARPIAMTKELGRTPLGVFMQFASPLPTR
jgi:hypothetical protein